MSFPPNVAGHCRAVALRHQEVVNSQATLVSQKAEILASGYCEQGHNVLTEGAEWGGLAGDLEAAVGRHVTV